ncbi:MAG: hypothetical protein ABWY22_13335 [Flavobacterium sp.]
MKEDFVKKYWEEEGLLFYIHFQNDIAVRQIEVKSEEKIYLSIDEPISGDSMLYDQLLYELDLEENDFITREEFNQIWERV